jgi:hypothetical protein
MVTGITSQVAALVTAIAVLTGGAILRGGPAAADPNQDKQFLALLEQKDIPAIANVPSLIATAHKVCLKLADGMPAEDLVDALVNYAYRIDPTARLYAPDRVARTQARFITAAVEAYCPGSESKIASIMADYAPGATDQTNPVAEYTRGAVNSGNDLPRPRPASDSINMPAAWQGPTPSGVMRLPQFMDRAMYRGVLRGGRYEDDSSDCDAQRVGLASLIGAVLPQGVTPPNPPQTTAPPPPTAQTLTPPRPIAASPPLQRPAPPQHPPPPEQPPPEQPPLSPPEQPPSPAAVAPQPGGAGGSDGEGGSGSGNGNGGGPAKPRPAMPPGRVRLAP